MNVSQGTAVGVVAENQGEKVRRRRRRPFDYSLLLITICLVGFGLLMIYSASSFRGQVKFDDAYFFLKKQLKGVVLGVAAMLLFMNMDHRILMKRLPLIRIRIVTFIYYLAVVLQVMVYFVGEEYNGSKRWLGVGGITFEPSEISKIALILLTAYFIQMVPNKTGELAGLFRIGLPAFIILLLVGKENLSAAVIIAAIVVGMCFVAAKKKTWLVIGFALLVIVGIAFIFLGDGFRMERVEVFKNIETHPKGFQILQGLYAIATGGIFGSGLGESIQKLGNIPEAYNDMIFTIICEELGVVGAAVVLVMFLILLWRIYNVATTGSDLFGSMICVGIMIQLGVQVFLNVAVVTNTTISTGVSLPFISYGGTSVAILMAEIGLVLGISRRRTR